MNIRYVLILFIIISLQSCNGCKKSNDDVNESNKPTPALSYVLQKSFPHDINSFTEGFVVHNGQLFESTGATEEIPQTRSLFGIVDTASGKITVKAELDKTKYFGEGITFLNGKIYQLTYKTKVGFVYDAASFKKLKEFTFPSKEGWGLTTDGTNLIMSDGTYTLTFLNPETFQVVKTLTVTENGFALDKLNELEYIHGFIYANVWTTNTIVKINPATGAVTGKLDLTALATEAANINPASLEMNGIAYDSTANIMYITGKMWPKIYVLEVK